jgi:hypothetical protein
MPVPALLNEHGALVGVRSCAIGEASWTRGVARIERRRTANLHELKITELRDRIIRTAGCGMPMAFARIVDTVNCGIE